MGFNSGFKGLTLTVFSLTQIWTTCMATQKSDYATTVTGDSKI